MHGSVIIAFLVLFMSMNTANGVARDCSSFGVSKCLIEPNDIIQKFEDMTSEEFCQNICSISTGCVRYLYEPKSQLCTMLNRDIRLNCTQVGGQQETSAECYDIGDEQTCDAFANYNCSFAGSSFVELEVPGAQECKQFCELSTTCGYWKLDTDKSLCLLFTSSAIPTCEGRMGPQIPPISACFNDTTTTKVTESTTPTASTQTPGGMPVVRMCFSENGSGGTSGDVWASIRQCGDTGGNRVCHTNYLSTGPWAGECYSGNCYGDLILNLENPCLEVYTYSDAYNDQATVSRVDVDIAMVQYTAHGNWDIDSTTSHVMHQACRK